jgi:3-methyladenine DNA glycosylase AlkD
MVSIDKTNSLKNLERELINHKNPKKAQLLARFFKTGPREYGEGDFFLGITVPVSRGFARKYAELSFPDIGKLLKNKYHEARLVALLILVHNYKKAKTEKEKKKIFNFYLTQTKYINNWDLVDLSASYIVGDYLLDKDRKILEKLARSKNIWERRITVIATFAFIYRGEPEWTFQITRILLKDPHDLIQKAVGWMLREVGKRVSEKKLENFLDKNTKNMSRITLRYAIERLPESKRKYYLNLK